MKKELEYFEIDGAFGGSQDWFTNVVMHIGGCGAATACDCCIYFALYCGMSKLYPFNIQKMNKEDYKRFSQIMKPYIRPRAGGVKKPEWFIEGFQNYIQDVNRQKNSSIQIDMQKLDGSHSFDEAKNAVIRQIDGDYPVPYLMLRHKNQKFKDFIWHWFLVVGYEEKEDDFLIKTATYGEATVMSLKELWDTGCDEKGGIILMNFIN